MTLSTSVNKRAMYGYLAAMIFCMVFSGIYEYFSHQVYSIYMIGLFLIPLLLGLVPAVLTAKGILTRGDLWTETLQQLGVSTMILASGLTGVFEIYGTTSAYTIWFWVAGVVLLAAAMICYMAFLAAGRRYSTGVE